MFGRFLASGLAAVALFPSAALAQANEPEELDAQMRAAWVEACEDWDDWDKPAPPFRVFANTWYVGTCGISVILIAGNDSHVLIDSGTEAGAQVVLANLEALAIDPVRIGMILQSHEHHDHVGGMARLAEAAGHGIVSTRDTWQVNATGRPDPRDPQFAVAETLVPVEVVATIEGGMVVGVDNLRLNAIATPGHTPGAMSWQWQSCDDTRCLTIVYADSLSPVSAEVYRFSDHPEYVEAYREGLARLAQLECDILLTPHPSASEMRDKLLAGDLTSGMNCAEYAEMMDTRLSLRLAEEEAAE